MNEEFDIALNEFLSVKESFDYTPIKNMIQRFLIEEHPTLLTDVRCGIHIYPGWIPLVYHLCSNIQKIVDSTPNLSVSVDQVKEKFGTLRFYTTITGGEPAVIEQIDRLIRDAESRSASVCEYCGKPGRLTRNGWIKSACEEHERRN